MLANGSTISVEGLKWSGRRCVVFAAAALSLALVAPGRAGSERAPTEQSIVRKGNYGEPESLDPQLARSVSAQNVLRDLYEGLIAEAPDGRLLPGVAERWSVSEDGRTYRFHLRDDARWSDGEPVRASDFVRALRHAVDARHGAPHGRMLAPIVGAEAITAGNAAPESLGVRLLDERTLDIHLVRPTAYFLSLLTHSATYPRRAAASRPADSGAVAPGNGAYRLQEWVMHSRLSLRRNRYYWDDEHTTVERIDYLPIENSSSELKRYRAGEIDWTYDIPVSQIAWLRQNLGDELHVAPYFGLYFYGFNTTRPPFDNPELRKALALSVDRETLLDKVRGLGEQAAYGWVPPGAPGYRPETAEWAGWTPRQRLQEARRLYERAGYGPQRPLEMELRYNTHEDHRRIAIVLAYQWKQALGVRTKLINEEWKVFVQNRRARQKTQLFRSVWIGDYADPMSFLELLHSRHAANDYGYAHPEYDALLAAAANEADAEARAALMRRAERLVLRDLPVLPIYFYNSKRLVKPHVVGWQANIMDHQYSKHLRLLPH